MASKFNGGADAVRALIRDVGYVVVCVNPGADCQVGLRLTDFGGWLLLDDLHLVVMCPASRSDFEDEVRRMFDETGKNKGSRVVTKISEGSTFWKCVPAVKAKALREAALDLLMALKTIDDWLLNTHDPLGDESLLNEKFVKSYKLASAAIARAEGRTEDHA